MNKLISILITLAALAGACMGQANFSATGTDASISTHFDYGTTPYTQLDTRISTSTNPVGGNGLTSPASLVAFHLGGKDYAATPDLGVLSFGGSFQFGTGSLLGGNVNSTAVFGVDQSYVTLGSNGACGAFRANGTCKYFSPNTSTLFVGVFSGFIIWQTNADNTHTIWGVVRGVVNGTGSAANFAFNAKTVADPNPFVGNGHLNVSTVSITPLD